MSILFIDNSLASVLPNQANQASNTTLTVNGQNTTWVGTNPQVTLRKADNTADVITATSVSVSSDTQLSASFVFAPDATPGIYDLVVDQLVLSSAFTVIELFPSLLSVVPNSAARGETVELTVTAENTFWVGSTPQVSMVYSGSLPIEFFATSVTVLTNNSLSAVFSIPENTSLGLHNLMIDQLTLTESFTVTVVDYIFSNNQITVAVYPNPATDYLHIEAETGALIRIFDLNGRLSNEIISQKKKTTIINLKSYKSGTYIVEVIHKNKRKTQKIVVR
ncbi:MAG: hypothetical protein CVT92_15155 [Bacteroidetes bacterium HGW-Bacteroidetes-1]|jgi:hypothetical protein|nr:MAG: hypothetical protein CVT92_15155 [Bacteroidetes bacterium HGW-Bacteroidetes-1]